MSGLWRLALRGTRRRPVRSGLTLTAIALGIAVELGVQVVVNSLDQQVTVAQQERAGASGLDVRVDAGEGLSAAQVKALGGLQGVAQAVPLYEKRVVAGAAGSELRGQTVTLVGLRDGSAALRPVQVLAGRLPRPGSTSEVAIDSGLAIALAPRPDSPIALGRRIQLITVTGPDEFTVVGMTAGTSGGPAFIRSGVFIDDGALQRQFALGLRTPLVALRLAPGASPAGIATEVHGKLGEAVTTYDPAAAGAAPLADLRPLLALLLLLSLVIGAGVTAGTVALAVLERRRDVGLLRAAGASTTQVFRLFAAEAGLLAAGAIPLGIGAGLALGAFLTARFSAATLPAPNPALSISAVQIIAAVVAGAGSALIGGLLPALGAARLQALAALRPHPYGHARGSRMMLSRDVTAPNRRRTALTLSGLSASIATAVAFSVLTAGALTASDAWVSHLFAGDVVVRSPVTQRDAVAAALRPLPGVTSVTSLRFLSASVGGSVLGLTAVDPSADAQKNALDVVTPDRAHALADLQNGPSVLAPAGLARAAQWHVGTQVPVATVKGSVYFTISGIVAHSYPAGDGGETLIVAKDVARAYFGAAAAGFDDLVVTTNGGASSLQPTAATYGMQAVAVDDIAGAARDALQRSIGLLLAIAVIAVVMAMLSVLNTLTMNVRQATRELALLRAVGMSRRHAFRLLLGEAGLLALIAAVLGIGLGCLIALPMLRAASSAGFDLRFSFPGQTSLIVAAALVAASCIATLGPARSVTRLSVATALARE